MEMIEFGTLIFVVALILLFVLLLLLKKGSQATIPERKSTVAFVNMPEEEISPPEDVYDLAWRPSRDQSRELHPELVRMLDEIEHISPMISDLTAKLNEPEINPREISQHIVSDQGLTSYILKRVNSPYYGLVQKVDNIFNAIVILGYNEIHRIVMEERLARIGIKPSREEWVHANLTAHTASYLATTTPLGVRPGTMVTLGMLHDIARHIMHISLHRDDEDLPSDPRARLQMEVEIYGADHAWLGGELARRWDMPPNLCRLIAMHHWPMFWPLREVAQEHADISRELAIISIADIAALNFTQDINGTYIGDDYYHYLKKSPRMDRILVPELTRDLKRIAQMGQEAWKS